MSSHLQFSGYVYAPPFGSRLPPLQQGSFPQAQQIALRPTKSSDAASAAASERWMADLQRFDSCRQVVKNWSPASPATIRQQTMWIVQFVQFGMEIFVDFPVPSLLPSRCIRFRMVWRSWQWPFQEPKLEVPTINQAKFSGLCGGISLQHVALYGTVPLL